MTPATARPDDSELNAYVDGLLTAARRDEIEAWLAADEMLAATVAHYRAQNEALHALYDPYLDRPWLPRRKRLGRDSAASPRCWR
ncbi:MAG: hypothetical protein VW644_03325 [Alphaproteobacteria bacterium]